MTSADAAPGRQPPPKCGAKEHAKGIEIETRCNMRAPGAFPEVMTPRVLAKTEESPDVDDLVIRARHDADALGLLYERYHGRVVRYCMRRLFLREVAEDVTAEVFLRVARHMPKFLGTSEQDFENWLYAIATNGVNAHVRVAKRRRRLLDAAREERMALATARRESSGDDHCLDWPAVYAAIMQLNPRQQSVIVLRFWEGLDHRAIAEVLGCRPVAIRVMLMRALRVLRRRLRSTAT